ncbi:NAD-glutamate dehydrogenase [Devosia algicola]|uniref:NAD-glutamate dehydrogenase n=1 Tax=Devosia algicola TaxID=3026418 RepID=A0ABY7YP69_9HYPH|nr:NAD-glutamate dehydrogenase [Devosia algicola]
MSSCPARSPLRSEPVRGQALSRPELAVLLAYAKLTLYADLLESPLPDNPYLGDEPVPVFSRNPASALS